MSEMVDLETLSIDWILDKEATNKVDKHRGYPGWQAVRAALTLSNGPLQELRIRSLSDLITC
jgi:hypothetical protein